MLTKFISLKWLKFIVLATASAVVVYPVLLFLLVPILIYRFCVQKYLSWKDPKYQKVFSGLSAVIAGPDPYHKPILQLAPYIVFSEKISRQGIIDNVNEKIIKPNLYPELKQRLVKKFGYHIWQDVENFSLENHVRYLFPACPDKPVLKSELRGAVGEAVTLGLFDDQYPPWELVLVPNLFDPENPKVKSALFLHVPHAFMDGLSIIKFLQKTGKPWDLPVAQMFTKTTSQNSLHCIIHWIYKVVELLFCGPYYALRVLLSDDNSEFLSKVLADSDAGAMQSLVRKKEDFRYLSNNRVKQIRRKHDVGTTSVLASCLIEGMAAYIKRRCKSGFSKLPERFVMQMVIPLPGHPERLTNHWSMIRVSIKTKDTGNPALNVQKFQKKLMELSTSVVPLVHFYVFCFVGALPFWLRPEPKTATRQTLLFSSFPGPKESSGKVFGYESFDWSLLGCGQSITGITISSMCLANRIWFDFGAPKKLFQDQIEPLAFEDCLFGAIDEMEKTGKLNCSA